jgi:hypothetical protein
MNTHKTSERKIKPRKNLVGFFSIEDEDLQMGSHISPAEIKYEKFRKRYNQSKGN